MYTYNLINIFMLEATRYKIEKSLLKNIPRHFLNAGKNSISDPIGDFFYDPWKLKNEFKGSLIEDIWNSLPVEKGEARIISLESPKCYTQHADIDDRYHLNLLGDQSYLIDLDNEVLYKMLCDGVWYKMDAGKLHTAISIGEKTRVQVVVRKLLNRNSLNDYTTIKINPGGYNPRYHFDNAISPWLNKANKTGIINNFTTDNISVTFDIEKAQLENLCSIIPDTFTYEFR